jgi:hypothetical protein
MHWWDEALFDTCSLITVDKIELDDPELARRFFPALTAIEPSLSADNLYAETAERLSGRVQLVDLAPIEVIASLLPGLPSALAEVDRLVYATAAHFRLSVVTGDRSLARMCVRAGLPCADIALILRELVEKRSLSVSELETLLIRLRDRKEYILGSCPPDWSSMRRHRFP